MIQQFHFCVFIQRNKNTNLKRYMHPYVHCSIIYNSQGIEATSSVLVAQSCLTLCDPMDCSPPGSSVHEIFQARILE